jgi:hypothetical protein
MHRLSSSRATIRLTKTGRTSGAGAPELMGRSYTVVCCPRRLYLYLPQLSAAAGQHAYSLSWQSLAGPDAPMCLLDVELLHTPDLPEDLRQPWHHLFTTPGLHVFVGTQPGGSKQCWRPVIIFLQARRSHPTDQPNTQIHSPSRLAGGDFRSLGR